MVHATLFSFLKGAVNSKSRERSQEIAKTQQEDHAYARGNMDTRGPCPGLNSLANQGYLARDGKNISLPQVEAALMTGLHMSSTLASTLAHSLRPLCRADGTFDLHDMRRHNVIEHDRSFTRLDFRQGDNYTFQPAMFKALLDDAEGGPVTIKTIAKSYLRRKRECKRSGAPSLPFNLWGVNLLQTVSFYNTAAMSTISKETMTTFYEEERFPDAILQNPKKRTLLGLVWDAVILVSYVVFRT